MKLFPSAKALFAILLGLVMVAGLSACGGTGGEADTTAPFLELNPVQVTPTTVRTRLLSGKVEAGATVEVTADPALKPLSTIKAAVDGENWSCSVDLSPGVNTLFVKATDATGNNKTLTFVLTYDLLTLDPLLTATPLTAQTISGTLASGATLTGTVNGQLLSVNNRTIVGTEWIWTLPPPDPGVVSLDLNLVGTDSALQTTTLTPKLVVDNTLPVVTVSAAAPVGNSLEIGGTFDNGSILSLTVPTGVTQGTLVQDAVSGVWSCPLNGLGPGRNQIDVTATRTADSKQGTARLVILFQP
jgi:hypothetical protein